jgi:hypothetical protein
VLGRPLGLPPAVSGHNNYFLWGPQGDDGSVVIRLGGRLEDLHKVHAWCTDAGVTRNPWAMPYETGETLWVWRGRQPPMDKAPPSSGIMARPGMNRAWPQPHLALAPGRGTEVAFGATAAGRASLPWPLLPVITFCSRHVYVESRSVRVNESEMAMEEHPSNGLRCGIEVQRVQRLSKRQIAFRGGGSRPARRYDLP